MTVLAPRDIRPADLAAKVLESLPRGGILEIALDYDGTLVPIEARPELARADEGLRELLAQLAGRDGLHVSVVSGRSLEDLQGILRPPKQVALFAEHGASGWEPGLGRFGPGPSPGSEMLGRVRARLPGVRWPPGAWVEEKRASVALHTRACEADAVGEAEQLFREVWRAEDPGGVLSLLPGKCILEIRLPGIHKGLAVARLRERIRGPGGLIVYAGDDRTDEDAFRNLAAGDFGIRVGEPGTSSAAAYRFPDHRELRKFLASLVRPAVEAREGGAP